MNEPMRLVVHREIPECDLLRRQWNDLVTQMEPPEVFYTYEWASAVHHAYAASITPLLMLAYEGDSLVGVAALATDRTQKNTFFLGSSTSDYCDFVSRPQSRQALVEAVCRELRRLKAPMLTLANLPSDSVTCHALTQAAPKHRYWQFARAAYSCAQVALDSPERRQLALRSVRRRMRRFDKAMAGGPPITFSHSNSWDEISPILSRFAGAHVSRFLATGRISSLASSERRFFLAELARSLSSSGSVCFSRLMAGEQTIAWNCGFQFGGSWFWYQPTFDSNFQHCSPGIWLLSKIVEDAGENPGFNRIDLGLGAEYYKERLATGHRLTLHVTLAASMFRCWKERVRYYAAAALRPVPALESWARAQRIRLRSLCGRIRAQGPIECFKSLAGRCQKIVFHESEVVLLEWRRDPCLDTERPAQPSHAIRPIDLELLASAALHYGADSETFPYLLNAAERLRSAQCQGFALVSAEGVPLHFCWQTEFQDFYAEDLKCTLAMPSRDAIVLFDCWTPPSVRGQGFYKKSISRVASQLQAAGKGAWLVTPATNRAAVSGAERAGFAQGALFIRRRFLFVSRMIEPRQVTSVIPVAEISSAA
jgi:CelD/BcsL family acetyltransferase involved in cellulose biosynthesis